MTEETPLITLEQFQTIMDAQLPVAAEGGLEVADIGFGSCSVRQPFLERFLRPGGTISGPTMFAMADAALWGATMSTIGPVVLVVTTSLTINFLKKPPPGPLVGDCRLLKRGKRLCYGEVLIHSEGDPDPVAHATGTYSIPPAR